MQVALHNKVKIYNLTAGKSLPEWLAEKKKNRAMAGEQRIELIHDLEFPHFTRSIFRTDNGSFIFAAGEYPPRIKCYDVNQMSMKYSFNADMSIEGGVSLSADYRKFALRGDGRTITIHHSAVVLDRLRVPHHQRDLSYHEHSCELLSPGSSHEIFRVNLDTGAFVESFKTASTKGVNNVDYFKGHGLIVAACENGTVEAIDARMAKAAGQLVVSPNSVTSGAPGVYHHEDIDTGLAVTHVSCESGAGLQMCAGTSGGQVALYDIRSSKPLLVKDHMNSLPIVKTYFYKGSGAVGSGGLGGSGGSSSGSGAGGCTQVITADTKAVKIWNKTDGSNFTTIEAPAKIYDFCLLKAEHNLAAPYESPDSGVITICCDIPKVQVHFIPQLGVAPRWCSFLDSITEELEEKEATVVYDDFRFVSKEDFDAMGLNADDITDGKVRPYMHGFMIENRLYRELQAVIDPAGFNKHAAASAKTRRQEKKAERISTFKRVDATGDVAAGGDDRFAAQLKDGKGFEVSEKHSEYKKLLAQVEERREVALVRQAKYTNSQYTIVNDTLPEGEDGGGGAIGGHNDNDDQDDGDLPPSMRTKHVPKKGANATSTGDVTMFAAREGQKIGASDKQLAVDRKREREKKMSLADRLARQTKKRRLS